MGGGLKLASATSLDNRPTLHLHPNALITQTNPPVTMHVHRENRETNGAFVIKYTPMTTEIDGRLLQLVCFGLRRCDNLVLGNRSHFDSQVAYRSDRVLST